MWNRPAAGFGIISTTTEATGDDYSYADSQPVHILQALCYSEMRNEKLAEHSGTRTATTTTRTTRTARTRTNSQQLQTRQEKSQCRPNRKTRREMGTRRY